MHFHGRSQCQRAHGLLQLPLIFPAVPSGNERLSHEPQHRRIENEVDTAANTYEMCEARRKRGEYDEHAPRGEHEALQPERTPRSAGRCHVVKEEANDESEENEGGSAHFEAGRKRAWASKSPTIVKAPEAR